MPAAPEPELRLLLRAPIGVDTPLMTKEVIDAEPLWTFVLPDTVLAFRGTAEAIDKEVREVRLPVTVEAFKTVVAAVETVRSSW